VIRSPSVSRERWRSDYPPGRSLVIHFSSRCSLADSFGITEVTSDHHLTNEWGNGGWIAAGATTVIEGNVDRMLVRVTTDDSSSDLGEAYCEREFSNWIEAASAFIIGKDPFHVARIIFELQRCFSGASSQAGATTKGICGIKLAL